MNLIDTHQKQCDMIIETLKSDPSKSLINQNIRSHKRGMIKSRNFGASITIFLFLVLFGIQRLKLLSSRFHRELPSDFESRVRNIKFSVFWVRKRNGLGSWIRALCSFFFRKFSFRYDLFLNKL